MRCDKCGRPTDALYNKMPLCAGCKETVKTYRTSQLSVRQEAAAKGK